MLSDNRLVWSKQHFLGRLIHSWYCQLQEIPIHPSWNNNVYFSLGADNFPTQELLFLCHAEFYFFQMCYPLPWLVFFAWEEQNRFSNYVFWKIVIIWHAILVDRLYFLTEDCNIINNNLFSAFLTGLCILLSV